MSAMSHAAARLTETWAHGRNVADAMGITLRPTGRLRHTALLAWKNRERSYRIHGLKFMNVPIRVHLSLPDDGALCLGPRDADQRIEGTVLDFCLVVTRRRTVLDTNLDVTGQDAATWLNIAQAFAGPSTA